MKYLLLLSFFPLISQANEETQAELVFANEDFNRLFTKTESRRFLDREKRDIKIITPQIGSTHHQPKNTHGSAIVKVKGFILSETGEQKIWLSDEDSLSEAALAQAKTSNSLGSANKVLVQTGDSTKLLKPGQTWLVDEEKVTETYLLPKTRQATTQANSKEISPLLSKLNSQNAKQLEKPDVTQMLDKISTSHKILEKTVPQLEASN